MPSFSYTPAALVLAGAEINPSPIRFTYTAAALALSGANYAIGLSALSDTPLPRLQRQQRYVNEDGTITQEFQLRWQRAMERIEERFDALETALEASALAATAVQTANEVSQQLSLANSWVQPSTAVTASSDGTVTIAAHTRYYSNTSSVAVNGGSVTGYAPGSYVTVYYNDAARAGGAVSYQGTTGTISQEGAVHIVGAVQIPAVGQPAEEGFTAWPPGYVPPFGYF